MKIKQKFKMTFKIRKNLSGKKSLSRMWLVNVPIFPLNCTDYYRYCYFYLDFIFLSLMRSHHICLTAWIIGLSSKSHCSSLLVNSRKETNQKSLFPLSKKIKINLKNSWSSICDLNCSHANLSLHSKHQHSFLPYLRYCPPYNKMPSKFLQ